VSFASCHKIIFWGYLRVVFNVSCFSIDVSNEEEMNFVEPVTQSGFVGRSLPVVGDGEPVRIRLVDVELGCGRKYVQCNFQYVASFLLV
jgi:hypothetical protein